MGFFKKIFKGIKKVVKGVAKGIKKVGKGIWKGIKKVGKGFMKVVNKLGPLGMIALNFIPGVGTMMAGMWNTFGSTMGQWAASSNILTKAVGTLGKGMFNGVNWIKGTAKSITDGVGNAFKSIGDGNFAKGASEFGKGFSDAITGKGGAAGIEAGTSAATKAAVDAAGTLNTQAIENVSFKPQADIYGTEFKPGSLTGEMQFKDMGDFGTGNIGEIKVTGQGTPGIASGVRIPELKADPTKSYSFVDRSVQEAATSTQESFMAKADKGPTLAQRALKAGQAGLQAYMGQQSQQQEQFGYMPGYTPPESDMYSAGQLGSLGSGSAGGTFLSEEQVASYNGYWNRSLGIGQRVGGTV